jgi:hypothetical protein
MLEVPSHQQDLKALVTLNFSCPAVLTSIDLEPFALTILLTFKKVWVFICITHLFEDVIMFLVLIMWSCYAVNF